MLLEISLLVSRYLVPSFTQLLHFIPLVMMKKNSLFVPAIVLAISFSAQAQSVSVNTTGTEADASSIFDVSSTSKGVLIPRMTSGQRTAIGSPAQGLLVYQTDPPVGFYYNKASSGPAQWVYLQPAENVTTQGNTFNAASQLVRLDASGKLPAVDGSQLTNLPATGSSFLYSGWFANPTSQEYKFPVLFQNVVPSTAPPYNFPSEDLITYKPPANGVIDNLVVRQVHNNTGSSTGIITVTLYKNGAPTALTCSFTNVLTGVEEVTDYNPAHAVSVTPSDRLYFVANQGALGSNTVFRLSTTVRFR